MPRQFLNLWKWIAISYSKNTAKGPEKSAVHLEKKKVINKQDVRNRIKLPSWKWEVEDKRAGPLGTSPLAPGIIRPGCPVLELREGWTFRTTKDWEVRDYLGRLLFSGDEETELSSEKLEHLPEVTQLKSVNQPGLFFLPLEGTTMDGLFGLRQRKLIT